MSFDFNYRTNSENIVRQSYVAPDEVDTATQISELEIDLRKAKDSGNFLAV
jgi:hypothetical protein